MDRPVVTLPEQPVTLDVVAAHEIIENFRAGLAGDFDAVHARLRDPDSASRIEIDEGRLCRVVFLRDDLTSLGYHPFDVSQGSSQISDLFPFLPGEHEALKPILAHTLADFARQVPEARSKPVWAKLDRDAVTSWAEEWGAESTGKLIWLPTLNDVLRVSRSW